MEDEAIVRLYWERDERAIDATAEKYGPYCHTIAANILSATTRTLDGKIYGNMLLSIPGGPDELAIAVKYLSKAPSVTVQVDVEYTSPQEDRTEEVSGNE